MKLDPEKFALAVVQSSDPQFMPSRKLIVYKQAYELAEKHDSKTNINTKLETKVFPNN